MVAMVEEVVQYYIVSVLLWKRLQVQSHTFQLGCSDW